MVGLEAKRTTFISLTWSHPAILGMTLFIRLTEHLYLSFWDEAKREELRADPVPNRHAAIHGMIVYKSVWNALNVIFMADLAYQIVHLAKKAKHKPSA